VTQASWRAQDIDAGYFVLRSYGPVPKAATNTLTIYIEGDGQAWVTESQSSDDPSPRDAVALELAIRHPEGNAVYLARPCQFITGAARQNCRQTYWTDRRFAPEVVAAMDDAINQLKVQQQAKRLRLVGYSGGGAIAALVAARRPDVERLITVAGNLDHVTWTGLHHLSPLAGSLNPVDFWQSLAGIEQVHFLGVEDRIMPVQVATSYRHKFPEDAPISLVPVDGFDHRCCWAKEWPELWRNRSYHIRNATKVE
jgi:pimeloyl-ACP methyl ester carboxylesterase